ncbi:MAG TPA: hypothetical protein DD620_03510 [Verrucomicrobia bacterium]|nr:hypothetical protein [Verrucomicrobiota bacterium]
MWVSWLIVKFFRVMNQKIKFGFVCLVVGSVLGLAFMWLCLDKKSTINDRDSVPLRKKYTHQIISNLNWQMGFLHEIELIRVGSLRIEKRRFGGFSLGGYNQLIIDDLVITLPQKNSGDIRSPNHPSARKRHRDSLRGSAEEILAGYPSFSALKINNFKINAYLLDGTITNVLTANHGRLKKGAVLELNGCSFTPKKGARIDSKKVDLDANEFSVNLNSDEYNLYGI